MSRYIDADKLKAGLRNYRRDVEKQEFLFLPEIFKTIIKVAITFEEGIDNTIEIVKEGGKE